MLKMPFLHLKPHREIKTKHCFFMTYPRLFLAAVCCLFLLPVAAQRNFMPGKVKLQDADTLTGFIDYRNWDITPTKIAFKTTEAGPVETYGPGQLDYFEVIGKEAYIKAVVMKDMLPVDETRLSFEGAEHTVRDTAFLRILVSGDHVSLYQLVDLKEHFYIQQGADTLQELQYKLLRLYGAPNFTVHNIFRDQLKVLAFQLDKAAVVAQIEKLSYTEKALKNLVLQLNNTPVLAGSADSGIGKRKLQLFAGAGVMHNNIQFTGIDANINGMQAKASIGYLVNAGMDLFTQRRFQKLFLRTELQYSQVRYTGEKGTAGWRKETYQMQMHTFTPSVFLMYSVVRSGNIKPFVGIGGGVNFTTYGKNDFTLTYESPADVRHYPNYLKLSKSWSDFRIKAGLMVGDRLEITATHRLGGTFTYPASMRASNKMTALAVACRF